MVDLEWWRFAGEPEQQLEITGPQLTHKGDAKNIP